MTGAGFGGCCVSIVKEDCVTEKAQPTITHDPDKKPVNLKLPGKKATARRHSSAS